MKENQKLKITGTMLEKSQLEKHLEKIASSHNTTSKSQKDTYPVPQLMENFKTIEEVYNILNEHLKLGINIHPAGEWLLDNFYIIEEAVRQTGKNFKEWTGNLPMVAHNAKFDVSFIVMAHTKYNLGEFTNTVIDFWIFVFRSII